MIKTSGVDHIGLRVSDIDRSLAFYRDLLGWEVVMDIVFDSPAVETALDQPGIKLRNVMLRKDGLAMVEIIQVLEPKAIAPFDGASRFSDIGGITVLSCNCEDIEAAYRELSGKGVTILSAPVDVEIAGLGKTKLMFFRDPDGIVIEFVQAENTSFNA